MAKIPKPNPVTASKYFKQKLECTAGPIELHHWIEEKSPIQVIDVRRMEDFRKGHIPGAIQLPREQWEDPKGLSKNKTNIVYCYSQTCHLAAAAAYVLAKKGYPVVEMEGGFNAWLKAKLPVEC